MRISYRAMRELANEQGFLFSAGPGGRYLGGPDFRLHELLPDDTMREAVTGSDIGDICRHLGLNGVTVLLRDDGYPYPVGQHPTSRYVYDEAGEVAEVVAGKVALRT